MNLKIDTEQFRVKPDMACHPSLFPTKVPDFYENKDEYEERLREYTEEIQDLQDKMYAHDKHSLLIIFQGMDAAGKDGAIKHVMSGINPAGVQVRTFKRPSEEELDHDWLWRCYSRLPERGRIGIFNRSYYEEVLVVRVHPGILTGGQRIPAEHTSDLDKVWATRLQDMANVEDMLHRNGYTILKFFLNVSKDEQRDRLLERINTPSKNWKMNPGDIDERERWDDYMNCYEDIFRKTATKNSPWYAIPADDKKNARLIISQVVLETIGKLKMAYPEPDDEFESNIQEMKDRLNKG